MDTMKKCCMNKKLIIIGNTEHALTMLQYIHNVNYGDVVAFSVNEQYIREPKIKGIPVLPLEKLDQYYQPDQVNLILGIGYTKMGDVKEKLFRLLTDRGYQFVNFIHPTAIIAEDVELGTGNNILEGVILEAGVKLSDGNLLFGGTMIAHDTIVGSFNSFSVKVVVAGCSQVKNHCFVGANATVRDHVILEDYVLVGAAAYADRNLKEYSVLAAQKSVILEDKRSTDYL